MEPLTTAPRGTMDVLPQEVYQWHYLEQTLLEIAQNFGFTELRTPTFEHTELFLRSVGDTTDIVQKEMYTFTDKGDRSITLRPEGTAGVLRAAIEHGLCGGALPVKCAYIARCYRYEKPQKGRYRQFTQFGVELLGADGAAADAEVITLAHLAFARLGVQRVKLEINSIGCPECRKAYQQALVAYFEQYTDQLCETCRDRLGRNPMRILDCKSPVCAAIAKDAPTNIDFLCDDCKEDFERLQSLLGQMNIAFSINPRIVRGLDYYTRTVFEFVTDELGSQSAICAGGRYNGLVQELGGPALGGIGFGLGLDRLLLLMRAQSCAFKPAKRCDLYLAPVGEKALAEAMKCTRRLREEGFYVQCDIVGRSVKAQMKYANKIGAKFVVVIGDNELEQGIAALRDMDTGESKEVPLGDGLTAALYDAGIADMVGQITDDFEQLIEEQREDGE